MAKSPLIRTLVNNGKGIRFFNFDALTGQFVDRLLKIKSIGNIEISDPELETKLTNEQLATLRAKYPYLAPKVRKAEPLPLVESEPPSIDGIPDEHPVVVENPHTGKLRMADRPYEDGKPVEIVAEQPQTEPAKRGRKPKQA
jgi:outer membrane biosynthesis protein TonB